MYRNLKISSYQLFALLSGFMIGSTLIISPASAAKNEAWLAFLLGAVGGTGLLCMYVWIAGLNPSCTLIEMLKKRFGKVLGSVFSILYIWYFFHLAALVLRNFGEYSLATAYPETPILFVIICFALIIVLAVRSGIEVMGRMSEVFAVLLVLVLAFVFLALITEFDIDNFKPFMAQGIKPVIKTAFETLAFPFGETVTFLMVFKHTNKQKKLFKASLFSILFVSVLLLSAIVRNLMVLGADMVSREVFPSHIVFRLIPGLDVDPLLDVNLTVAGVIKVGICIYAAATGITELIKLDDYKPFVLPLVAFAVSLSIWIYGSFMEMVQWAIEVWPYYSIPFQIVIPFILLIFSLIKNKRASGNAINK